MINPCSGMKIEVKKGQKIEIVDVDGGQVVDFFAEMRDNSDEFVSPGVTIDCNESLRLNIGNTSNKYNPMFHSFISTNSYCCHTTRVNAPYLI